MVFWIEFRVSAASSRAIPQIVVLAILQTIALPTELPRRSPYFTRKLASEPNIRTANGVGNQDPGQGTRLGAFMRPPVKTIGRRRSRSGPKPLLFLDHCLVACP